MTHLCQPWKAPACPWLTFSQPAGWRGPRPGGAALRWRTVNTEPSTTVLLIDDHTLVARAIQAALDAEPGIEVVGVAGTLAAGHNEAIRLRPDVVLLDYRLPDGTGADGTRQILDAVPGTRVVVLTSIPASEALDAALEAGCCGFVNKDSEIDDLVAAVRAAARGDAYFSPEALSLLVGRRRGAGEPADDLSEREREVLQLVADGLSVHEIADQLALSIHTVRNHIRRLMAKLGTHTRLEAVVIGARRGLIQIRPEHPGPEGDR